MRFWQFWRETLILCSQHSPPRFIEMVMLLLAMPLLLLWGLTEKWPYLVLSLSYVVGSSSSVLIRERIAPSPYPQVIQLTAVLLLIVSLYSFAELTRYL
ncbi:hypothetical protein [Kamptonema formosum]|uniref:hypothetical protein n=1 Tax=Kamptonema formosum TaxID=331992 RepID=UPI000348EDD1|nr:hypothetical protein [Oscillatoria sp. PCC 10802]